MSQLNRYKINETCTSKSFLILGAKKMNKVYFIYALDFGVTSFEVVPLLNGRGLSRPNRVKYCSLAAAKSASSNISASFIVRSQKVHF